MYYLHIDRQRVHPFNKKQMLGFLLLYLLLLYILGIILFYG